jgi:hypothetical protein
MGGEFAFQGKGPNAAMIVVSRQNWQEINAALGLAAVNLKDQLR